MKPEFVWVKWFNELAEIVSDENQDSLSKLINQSIDDKKQAIIKYEAYDPFSFFYYLAQKKEKKKKKLLFQKVNKVFGVNAPLPDFDDDNCWMFPTPPTNAKVLYVSDEPKLLWDFFGQIISIKNIDELAQKIIDDDDEFINNFKSVLKLTGVGVTKLTQTLILINANIFFTIDKTLKPISDKLLKQPNTDTEKNIKQLTENIKNGGFPAYLKIMQKIKKISSDKTPYEINYPLWKNLENMKKFRKYLKNDTSLELLKINLYAQTLELGGDVYQPIKSIIEKAGYSNFYAIRHIKDYLKQYEQIRNIIPKQHNTNGNGDDNENLSETLGHYEAFLRQRNNKQDKELKMSETKIPLNQIPLNQILFGPPGTGKTYSTVGEALKILEATNEQKQTIKSIRRLKEVFKSRVEFVTFHQSFSYEDFVEGLKANSDAEKLTYGIENGVFKEICKGAETSENNSLKELNQAIEKLKERLTDDALMLETVRSKKFDFTYQGKTTFRIIPQSSEKFGKDGYKYGYPVKINEIIELFKNSNHETHYSSYAKAILKYLVEENKLQDYQETQNNKPHVLIIDEINRGNISRIFGELITLIELNKRAGEAEEISVKLPYSKTDFSVPNNLYIIGTMNTADRSLALMDTALRRRFDFIEMMPRDDLVKDDVEGIDVQKILKNINSRIEILYDREHTIGHSFLMNVENLEQLRDVFKNKILPLLEEYFYDDFAKIQLVLADRNDKFYQKNKPDKHLFSGMETDVSNKDIYQRNDNELTAAAFRGIYENTNDQAQ